MKSQKKRILEHLQARGSITSWEAIINYRITRLARVIPEIRLRGYAIRSVMEESNGKRYARYYLMQDVK